MLVAASSVPGSSADLAQNVVALALVAIAAGSLAWRMFRSVRHFFAVGGNSVGCGPNANLAAGSAYGIGTGAAETANGMPAGGLWMGGCGGGCLGCPGSSQSGVPATGGVVSINALTAPNPPSPDGQTSQAGAKSVQRTS